MGYSSIASQLGSVVIFPASPTTARVAMVPSRVGFALLSVLVGAQEVIVLSNGQPVVGEFLSGGRTTYHFDLPAGSQSDVVIRVTPLSGGNPDLCISQTTTRPAPSTSSCHWWGNSTGTDRVLIPASQLDLTKPLYVGVLDGRQGGIPSTSFAVPAASACAALSVVPAC